MSGRGEVLQLEVLDILRQRNKPVSAYDVLGELRKTKVKMAPQTVYRVLAALTECGKIHRLESLKAYVNCQHGSHQHASILSICDDCGRVEESVAPDLLAKLSKVTGKTGFAAQRHVIEVHGLCASCGTGPAPA
ncbi:Fur family transcriptional regulator [Actibacterium sp. 188UL27-1]|uniref:Fur family transcriptional regulator n=1 Tax=Actibacterium sp. 188UL27-1 TaxID=2786961 RepID=UPI00195E7CFC|nr:Fur family transcriptional regulator [Actibacterium sp. 188UL27-1]MBM7070328.1 transcriptional repressor [Actibacterium sp. 188UL27-1]